MKSIAVSLKYFSIAVLTVVLAALIPSIRRISERDLAKVTKEVIS